MHPCPTCKTPTNNKKYCSRPCQNLGARKLGRRKPCERCGTETVNSRFCSAECYAPENSKLRIEHYQTVGHHMTGTTQSLELRLWRTDIMIEQWQDPEMIAKRLSGLAKARKESEHPLGWSPEAIARRNATLESKGGHNWSGDYGARQCDIVFEERYGMTSVEYRQRALFSATVTSIEATVRDYFESISLDYEMQFKLDSKYYDFYLPTMNCLLEVDGDYWHAYGVNDNDLSEAQAKNRNNDLYKDALAAKHGYDIIRVWGHEVRDGSFINVIKSHLNG